MVFPGLPILRFTSAAPTRYLLSAVHFAQPRWFFAGAVRMRLYAYLRPFTASCDCRDGLRRVQGTPYNEAEFHPGQLMPFVLTCVCIANDERSRPWQDMEWSFEGRWKVHRRARMRQSCSLGCFELLALAHLCQMSDEMDNDKLVPGLVHYQADNGAGRAQGMVCLTAQLEHDEEDYFPPI